MASQLLVEGVLDAKGARGSEDRKFWKVWRRQWARFSVLYPSGRQEPCLVLTLSPSSSVFSDKELKLSRNGLRLFRCRSKSRPFRTWAITSGNKVVLYFAAESEIQAQNWMQAVRDGLWPPCFSFQMLTACSYEVSLVDDDNTFMAGHLGVYGRFVLTSDDVISLKHPHWGSTLLEIALDNIIDVLFIREAEISTAGVFSIILKRIEGSNVKALQFFCNTVEDAMQWILSKLYARRKSFSASRSRKSTENRVSFSVDFSFSKNKIDKNVDNKKTIPSIDNRLVSSQVDNTPKNITDPLIATNLEPIYENIRSLQMDNFQNEDKYSSFDKEINELKINTLTNMAEEVFLKQSDHYFHDSSQEFKSVDKNKLLGITSNENTYENILNATSLAGVEGLKNFDMTDHLNGTECAEQNKLNKTSGNLADDLPQNSFRDESAEYAVVNKSHKKKLEELHVEPVLSMNKSIHENFIFGRGDFIESETICSPESFKNGNDMNSLSSNASCNVFPSDIKIDQNKSNMSKYTSSMNQNSNDLKLIEPSNSNDQFYITANKNGSNNSKSIQYLTESFSEYRNSNLLPNFPSDFLDTSSNSFSLSNKDRGSSSSSEEDNGFLSLIYEFDELKRNEKSNENIYEDILERKGTIYEEIDEAGDEQVNPSLSVPELPARPANLEIPKSQRLQKLCRNIQSTLEVLEDKKSQKVFRRPNFIKKIKDVNRIMHLSPNQEYAKKSFEAESRLKIDTRSETASPSRNPKLSTAIE